jgi:hypothetical protein
MLAAINFYCEHSLETHEIDDAVAKRMLPAKSERRKLSAPKRTPQLLFGVSHALPQPPRKLCFQECPVRLAFHPIPTPALPLKGREIF